MSAKAVDDASQQAVPSGSTEPYEGLRNLIWSDEIHDASAGWASDVELLFLEFNQPYLKRHEWLACVRTVALSFDPSERQAIKERLMGLYLSASGGNSLSSKECENFAEAWIHAAAARRAVIECPGDAVQAHLNAAYTLLTANTKIRLRRVTSDNKAKGRQECIEEFAKLVQSARPVGGWKDHKGFIKALGPTLAAIIDQKERKYKCGALFRKAASMLIFDWIGKKGPVCEAYRGRKS